MSNGLRFKYETIEFGIDDIHIRSLRDKQEYADPDNTALELGIGPANWSLFGTIWDSSRVLAQIMHGYNIEGKRILEVGCGTALSSLILNLREADISATDYHPEVKDLLLYNTGLNNTSMIPYERTHWEDCLDSLGQFDLIIGSDLLYERGQVDALSAFVDYHAKNHCEIIIVDPNRKNINKFSRMVTDQEFNHRKTAVTNPDYVDNDFRCTVNYYQR